MPSDVVKPFGMGTFLRKVLRWSSLSKLTIILPVAAVASRTPVTQWKVVLTAEKASA